MAATQLGFYLFVFYTAVVGLPAWMAGLVLMVLKVHRVVLQQVIKVVQVLQVQEVLLEAFQLEEQVQEVTTTVMEYLISYLLEKI